MQVQFKPSLGGGQLDEYWNNLVLGVIGGTIEPADVMFYQRVRGLWEQPANSERNVVERNISCWDTVEPMAIEFVHVARTLSYGGVLGAQSWKSWLRIERNSTGLGLSQEDLSQRDTSH